MTPKRSLSFYILATFFGLFLLFLYGPIAAMMLLSLQGPEGSLTFPMQGWSFHWLQAVFQPQRVGEFVSPFWRSLTLGLVIMGVSVVVSVLAGLGFRQRFRGAQGVFYLAIASLIVPSILVSLGIGLFFERLGWSVQWYNSALGGHLTWTLPFAFLIMVGVFNRFNPVYEAAARDLGASDFQTFWQVVLPLIAPNLIGVAMLSFTLSYDEFNRTSLISGEHNTLPLEIFGMTTNVTSPAIYALGTLTTVFSFVVVGGAIALWRWSDRRQSES
ncbi:MAG: ABC transporter permease [Spirulina sp. SIO3F2]|nr:ABC transporter permease [Spirulina sp. SIO3F2]